MKKPESMTAVEKHAVITLHSRKVKKLTAVAAAAAAKAAEAVTAAERSPMDDTLKVDAAKAAEAAAKAEAAAAKATAAAAAAKAAIGDYEAPEAVTAEDFTAAVYTSGMGGFYMYDYAACGAVRVFVEEHTASLKAYAAHVFADVEELAEAHEAAAKAPDYVGHKFNKRAFLNGHKAKMDELKTALLSDITKAYSAVFGGSMRGRKDALNLTAAAVTIGLSNKGDIRLKLTATAAIRALYTATALQCAGTSVSAAFGNANSERLMMEACKELGILTAEAAAAKAAEKAAEKAKADHVEAKAAEKAAA